MDTFAFVALHLFSAERGHVAAFTDILHLIVRPEDIHTKVHGMMTSSCLATTLIYDVSRQWSLHINRCISASFSNYLGATGSVVTFLIDPILVDLEGGRYMGTILPATLADLVRGWDQSKRAPLTR